MLWVVWYEGGKEEFNWKKRQREVKEITTTDVSKVIIENEKQHVKDGFGLKITENIGDVGLNTILPPFRHLFPRSFRAIVPR